MIVVYLSTGKEEVIWAYGSTLHAKLYRKPGQRPNSTYEVKIVLLSRIFYFVA
jgi:hypothetical protein